MIKKWKSKLLFKLQYVESFSFTISCFQWLVTKKEFFCKKQGQDPARNWAKPVKDINGLHLFPYNLWVFSSFCSTILSQLVVICLLLCHLLLQSHHHDRWALIDFILAPHNPWIWSLMTKGMFVDHFYGKDEAAILTFL
jgi:hypothetical protein